MKQRKPSTRITRRFWRRLYRRARVYMPLLALILIGMLVYLPLSPPWLARKAEAEASRVLGFPVEIDRVQMRLLTGEVTLTGLRTPAMEPGGAPFEIGEVRLEGALRDLLAGDGRWPATVTIASPTPMELIFGEGGMEPAGGLATLIARLEPAVADPPALTHEDSEPDREAEAPARIASFLGPVANRPTPAIVIRNVRATATPPGDDLPPISLALDIKLTERVGRGERIHLRFDGMASIGAAEVIGGTLSYLPGEERLTVSAQLAALADSFELEGLGEWAFAGRRMELEVGAVQRLDGDLQATIELLVNDFELAETRVGGYRWDEERLRLLTQVRAPLDLSAITVESLRLSGQDMDLLARGTVGSEANLPVDARVEVRRIPGFLFTMAQAQARAAGLQVEPLESSRLEATARVTGELLDPLQWEVNGTVELERWSVSQARWAKPLIVRHLTGRLSPRQVEVSQALFGMGDFEARISAQLPYGLAEGESMPARAEISARGPLQELVLFAKNYQVLPPELSSATLPITLAATWTPNVRRDEDGYRIGEGDMIPQITGTLAWEPGTVELRDLPGSVQVEAGVMEFSPERASISYLRGRYGDTALDLNASARPTEPGDWHFEFDTSIVASGPISQVLTLIQSRTALPFDAEGFGGFARAELSSSGTLAEWEALDYELSLAVQDASGIVPLQYSTLAVDRVFGEVSVSPKGIELRRLNARVEEAATVSLTGRMDAERIEVIAEADTPMWVVEKADPVDFEEIVVDGEARARAVLSLVRSVELPEAPDVPRQWLAALASPQALHIGISEDSPIRFAIDGRIYPGRGATVFYRDFPHPVTDIRGDVTADVRGFTIRDTRATVGGARNVLINGRVQLPLPGEPLVLTLDIEADELDINQWLEGWGEQEWAERPFVRPARPGIPGRERLLAVIEGNIKLRRMQFLTVRGEDTDADLRFDAWAGRPGELTISRLNTSLYGGTLEGAARLFFPLRGFPSMQTVARFERVELQDFLTDLLETPQEIRGRITGETRLDGVIGDYSTWEGEGNYLVTDSRLIGSQVLRTLVFSLNLGREATAASTTMRGTASLRGEVVRFPDFRAESDAIRIIADGGVGFSGRLDFLITVDILSRTVERIPVIGFFGRLANRIANTLVTVRMTGTVGEPQVTTVPVVMDAIGFFRTPGSAQERAEELTERGAGVLRRDFDRLREELLTPAEAETAPE